MIYANSPTRPAGLHRDQFFHAEWVQILRPGQVRCGCQPTTTRSHALREGHARFTAQAKRTADAMGRYGSSARAVTALAALK